MAFSQKEMEALGKHGRASVIRRRNKARAYKKRYARARKRTRILNKFKNLFFPRGETWL